MTAATTPRVITAMASAGEDAAVTHLALNTANVARIQQVRGYPAISILMSSGPTSVGDRARLARLVEIATARLLNEFSRPAVQPLLDELVGLAANAEVGPGRQGIALFASADLVATVGLPVVVRERTVVDETFATRDLVHALLRSPHYRVLVLANVARLYEGVGADLTEIVDGGFPFRGDETFAEPARFGVDRSDTRDAGLRRHLRAVDTALAGHLDSDQPLLVVGASRRLSLFRQHSRHRSQITEALPGNFEQRSATELAQAIWPSVTNMFDRRHQDALAELDRAVGERRYAFGVQQAWTLANQGSGALIVVEENYVYPARIDPHSNGLVAAADVAHPEVVDDVVDEIIEIVLAKGGRATIVPDGTLATRGQIAMALRYGAEAAPARAGPV